MGTRSTAASLNDTSTPQGTPPPSAVLPAVSSDVQASDEEDEEADGEGSMVDINAQVRNSGY